jgi:integrase
LNLALETGLRWSEWSPLRVKDLNLKEGVVTVSRHWTQDSKGRKVLVEGHKTGLDEKTANISAPLAQALEVFIGETSLQNEDLIFPAPKGGLMSYNNYRNRIWEPARLAAGINAVPYRTGTHTTKRTAITQAHEGGLSDATIIGQTKHSNTKVIHDSYIQTSELAGKVVADKIYERLGIVD